MFDWTQVFANWLVYDVFGIAKNSKAGSALNFFVFDTIKIFILLLITPILIYLPKVGATHSEIIVAAKIGEMIREKPKEHLSDVIKKIIAETKSLAQGSCCTGEN